jgi:hypothetical protein
MRSPRELTRAEVVRAANNFRWTRKGAKWTVIVGERELPARPLVLEAAGVPPNDPTNSHQAVEILRRLGFETRYTREQPEMRTNEEEESLERGVRLDSGDRFGGDKGSARRRVGSSPRRFVNKC